MSASPDHASLDALIDGVELLSLDAGNTVIFLEHARIAAHLETLGVRVPAEVLVRTEGEAKRQQASSTLERIPFTHDGAPGAAGWASMVGTLITRAGVPLDELGSLLDALWVDHVRLNLWSKVPDGLGHALDEARALGLKVAIVSNSEGMLVELFKELGIGTRFDLVVDSGIVGVEKPDPRIFRMAYEPFGIAPGAVLHLGDSIATDVVGARAAGVRYALIDPFGHFEG
ncbi:HAD family hydrolase, partial [bacterium]